MSAAEDDWEWPAEPTLSPYYVQNRIVAGEAPAPPPAPKLLSRGPATASAGASSSSPAPAPPPVTIRDYAWSDDGAVVKVYVPLPGVRKDATTVEIRDDGVDLRSTVANAVYVLRLRKLFDRVYPSASSYKVLESKDKVVLTLAKRPVAHDDGESHRTWPTLHLGAGAEALSRMTFDEGGGLSRMSKELSKMTEGMSAPAKAMREGRSGPKAPV